MSRHLGQIDRLESKSDVLLEELRLELLSLIDSTCEVKDRGIRSDLYYDFAVASLHWRKYVKS